MAAPSNLPTAQSPAAKYTPGRAEARYQTLMVDREPYLIRGRRLSRLTLPSVFRERGENGTTSETIPWSSGGAYCCNNLMAHLVMSMFPPGIPFVNIKTDPAALQGMEGMTAEEAGELKVQLDKGLSKVEMQFIDGCEEDGDRAVHADCIKHLLIGGNHALHVHDDALVESIPLERYVTLRDPVRRLIEAVVDDPREWATLPDDLKAIVQDTMGPTLENPQALSMKVVHVYTHIRRIGGAQKDGQFRVCQEIMGKEVPGSEHVWDADALPYHFIGINFLEGEHYSRSFCEDYEGDLQTLDGHWQAITEGSLAIARLVWMIKPGGVTSKAAFEQAANGSVMTGDVEEVGAARAEKWGDLQVPFKVLEMLQQRMDRAFALNSAIQRQGERVTATEVQYMARELEATLGSVYSNLLVSYQQPYARTKLQALQRNGRVVKLPKGTTKMTILTGDAALGRLSKSQSMREFFQFWAEVMTPEVLGPYLDVEDILQRDAADNSIDTDGLIKSEDQVQAAVQQQQQQQVLQNVAPNAVDAVGRMAQDTNAAALGAAAQPAQSPPDADQQPQAA